jgi:hypothetical protein
MTTIKIDNLNSVGSEFFQDDESYLNELTNEELDAINGLWGHWSIAFTTFTKTGSILRITLIRR